MHYGDNGTIHQCGYVDVEIGPDGKVVSVWFRCMALGFKETRVDQTRANEMISAYQTNHPPAMNAIDFDDIKTTRQVGVFQEVDPDPNCPDCHGTGTCDSGGTTPWEAPIEVRCDCTYGEAE